MRHLPLLLAATSILFTRAAWAADGPRVLTLMVLPESATSSTESPSPTEAGVQHRKLLTLETPDDLPTPPSLMVGPSRPVAGAGSAGYSQWLREIPQHEAALERKPDFFDQLLEQVGDIFDSQDIEGPLGTLSTVHFLPPVKGNNVVLPFFSLSQDADELDAHLRLGAGAGATWRIDQQTSLNAEIQYLESAGDVNPATSSETRGMITFIRKF